MASTPQQSQEDNQADGFSKVKVTILASEWGSSNGGLSTINRELAIQLAKCPEVEITFFLPKCSEEDKNIALGHKIEIVEATRRPGFEELEWLSFPPENLQIDVIVGHGIKLGHQAQVIRHFKKCKWVQVAHTDPEELGMFKNYPDSISKGEEKHKTEVELCEMADLVVGVGPKLSEAFRSYICGCQNDPPVTVLDFTPGVFDEFASVKQFPINKDKSCSILVFGCGDAEDFEVKGFDIAGKAVATLPNTRLVFVGAPDGKHEEIARRFTGCGVPASRLRIRGYMESREHLKHLFQEVDLVLLPSRTEGFGLTGLEALSAGLPVIISHNSGFGKALSKVPFGSSFVVDSEDPKVWAEAIKRIWDKDRQGQLEEAETLRTSYEKKYSWSKQSKDLVDKMMSIVHAMSASTSVVISSGNTADVASNQPTEENTTAMSTNASMETNGDVADANEHLESQSTDDNQQETRNTPSSQTFSQPYNVADKRKRGRLFANSERKRSKKGPSSANDNLPKDNSPAEQELVAETRDADWCTPSISESSLIHDTVIKHSYQDLSDEQQEIVHETLIRQIQVYIKHHNVTSYDGVGGLIEHIKETHHLALKSVGISSLVIIVQCPTQESLESLWDDYCSGRLNEVAERYLVTDEIKRKLNLETIKLKTSIEEENYLICKKALMETSPLTLSQRTSTAAFDSKIKIKMQLGELEEALELLNEWRMIDPKNLDLDSVEIQIRQKMQERQSRRAISKTQSLLDISVESHESSDPDQTSFRQRVKRVPILAFKQSGGAKECQEIAQELEEREKEKENRRKKEKPDVPKQDKQHATDEKAAEPVHPVHPERNSAPSSISQSFQGNVVAKVRQADKPVEVCDIGVIPEGVCVVCDHFLQAYRNRPTSISMENKTCVSCRNLNKLKYAVWNKRGYWQEMRPYPASKVPPKVTLDICRHFTTYRPCPKTTCSFPHGKVELAMWTLERKGVLPTPRETLTGSPGKSSEISANTKPSTQLRYRPSPSGVPNGAFKLCKSYYTRQRCRFGRGCIFAHGNEELKEWQQEYMRKEREKLRKEFQDKDEIVSMEMATHILKGPAEDLVEFLPGVEVTCTPPELSVKLQDSNDTHSCQWTFTLIFKTSDVGHLRHVLLLHRYHNCYQLSEICVGCENYKTCYTAKLKDFWYKVPDVTNLSGRVTVSLTVAFESSLYGSFDQCVVFDFGKKPYLIQKLNADVQSESLLKAPIVSQHLHVAASAIWDERSMEVVRFVHKTGEALQGEHLSRMYSLPKQVKITADELSRSNYKNVMHQLLFVEEGFMKDEISRYTLNYTQLHAQRNIFDEMTGMKCAVDGELFGILYLHEEDALRPDDAAGRLLYRNVSSLWLQLADSVSNKVYEAPVEKVESKCVVLRLSSKICSDLNIFDTCDVSVNAQFQLNRWPLCEMHSAIDRLTTGQLRFIFPKPGFSIRREVTIRWQWLLDQRLNENQKTVIKRIASIEYNAPPLVVFGPFGTGKTFTLNQAVRLLVQVDNRHRILLCTHSNRAADIHVELLHKYLTEQNGTPAARPLRVYQPMRRLETASKIAKIYCLIQNDVFVLPSRNDLVEHRVVVTTLSTSQVFLDLQVLHGFFTHILIDEAAQALEPEALTPLIFAGPNTKIVCTGDHMQMSPEVYSPQARCSGLQKSLAERLFDMYDENESEAMKESNVVFLTENYRCHQDILQFPSDNFYGEKLVARGHASQLAHPKYGPLLFFSARGKEQKEHNNSYINLPEVYEVVKRVKEVAQSWPTPFWGPRKLSEIAVLSSYRYQVQAIRNGLRKDKDLKDVKVDTIHNVQGEEFRALFISTVRTFHTCKPQREEVRASGSDRQLYWEFLSDPKLLNTAVTRARCLIAVVGDPVSLCTVGECRSIWRDYIKRCDDKGGLYGTTMAELEKEINAAIASIELNPKEQPFVPKSLSAPEQNADVTQANTGKSSEEALEERRGGENDGKVQPLKVKEGEPLIPQERSANVMENHQDVKKVPSTGTAVDPNLEQNQEYKEEEEVEVDEETKDGIVESGDLQDDLLEDETVSPRYMDEIILAFVKKCEETLQLDAERKAVFDNSEFPPLQASGSKEIKPQAAEKQHYLPFKSGTDMTDLFPEIRVINGRVEVRLTNLGFYKSPSERAQQIMASSKQQEFLDPSVLRQLLRDDPKKYIACNLRISPEKFQVGYATIEDTETPDIQIKGRIRQAFDKDKVVLELAEKKARSKTDGTELQVHGKVVGVLEHMISPHERQFVCTTDYENPALMVPINKSATKLVNLSDKSCKDIPIYKKDQNERATQVKLMKREKVLSGKYLFVVKYLQWRREFSHPLGIVVRAMPRGEDLKSSMEIAFAERGIRKAFKKDTTKYVKEKFPPQWSIPENEYANRSKIDKAVTIDPPTSLDLDDALTIERTSPSTFVVGIHIADVSFFVKPNSPLDHEAFLRCTSYYPGEEQENVPMLPRELSESHCSLLPDQDRLAVSVFVTLDNEGRITEGPKIQRTIVRSCCRLSYAEAQIIIEKRGICTIQVPEEIVENIRQLSSLAQKRRLHRLEDRAFDHWQNQGIEEHVEAHELVEEMMILANEEIGKLLSEKCSELAPLRVQLPPKDHRLAEWIEMHGMYARLSLQFTRMFQNNASDETSPLNILHSDKTMFKIQRWVWGEICQAAESCDLPRLHYLICNERNHPQIAAAQSHFRRIQSEARYVCEGDQPSGNIQHYSLGIRSYTHFTSPIRRYIDVAVHRLLLALQSGGCYEEGMSKDDITKVCRRSTFMQDNARKFDKDCKRIYMATKLQQRCHGTLVFIESVEPKSISLHICKPEDDQLAGRQKIILFSHMNPVALKEEGKGNDREKCIVLKWKIRKYVAPDSPRNLKEDDDDEDAKKLAGCSGVGEVAEIPSNIWIRVLDAVRANEENKLTTIIKQTEASLSIMYPSHTEEKLPQLKSPDYTRGVLYKHPHYDENTPPSSNETVFHFYEKSLALRKYDFFSVQLCPRVMRGILEPDIQMVKVNSHLNICIEHRRYPRESFAHTARHQASRERYGTIDEYIRAWKPVLAMEAATDAVKENDGFIIEHLNLKWEQGDGSVIGLFSLPSIYCRSRQMDFYLGDLACIRVPYSDSDFSCDETSAQKQISPGDSVENQRVPDFWVGHCIIKEVHYEKETKRIEVKMDLHQTASNIPEQLTNGNGHRCTLELIHRTLPQRRMYAALCSNLEDSSELVHAICKGEEPTKEHFDAPPSNMSLVQYGFKTLNQYQEAAVKEALSKPFTLIQGPPGTGKTVTGVHIAYWFAERNKRLKSYKVWENETGDNKVEGAYKAPPQLIYCGPSNKAVDVVTVYLMKIPDLKVLRVYSDQIEQKEFPIPNKLKPARITKSDDELKMSSEKIRCVSLHHVIRRLGCPFEEELRQFEEEFAEHKSRGEIISQKEVDDYCKVIGQAERWALEKSGAQIILCTCAASGSSRIASSCDNIQQCIVDECGMCMEPESLVPITCSGARQVVLIGDHKQLQPVIQDHVAKTLGLSVSMFERHSKRATMLEMQYRMHKGICEFPSKQFYDGKLQTADVVNSRDPSPVCFWPAQVRRNNRNLPIVFCHVEGQEESSAITTSESNEESKRNMKEVRKVVQVAKYLINRYGPRVRMSDVVILSPYREQRSKINELLKGAYEDIQVTTITKSQGSEWDYVIISLVRSLKEEDIDSEPSLSWLREHLGFLTDEHQMNVGLTRARRGLCIIGNKNLLGMDEMWKKLLEHYEENHSVVDESWPWQ